MLKPLVKKAFRALGYDVRKSLSAGGSPERNDPYDQQVKLFAGRQPRVIFDLGANTGQTAARYLELFPAAAIYCFEPFAESYNRLSERHAASKAVRTYQLAVADSSGERALFSNSVSDTNSLFPTATDSGAYVDAAWTATRERVSVNTTTLDDFCGEQGIQQVDVLKMDIQGAELMALKGARRLLDAGAIGLVYTEVLFAHLYDGQAYFDEICAFLRGQGFVLYGLYELHYGKCGALGWGDAIFLSAAMAQRLEG